MKPNKTLTAEEIKDRVENTLLSRGFAKSENALKKDVKFIPLAVIDEIQAEAEQGCGELNGIWQCGRKNDESSR